MRAVGKYRIRRPEREEDRVCVMLGKETLQMRESTYRDNGYEPPLETLAWESPHSEQVEKHGPPLNK